MFKYNGYSLPKRPTKKALRKLAANLSDIEMVLNEYEDYYNEKDKDDLGDSLLTIAEDVHEVSRRIDDIVEEQYRE